MQYEITKEIPLLNEKGHVTKEGWARYPYWQYDRKQARASRVRLKEWDYYLLTNQQKGYAISATISDLGYDGFIAIAYMDYKRKTVSQTSRNWPLPLGRVHLSSNCSADSAVAVSKPPLRASFIRKGNVRRLIFAAPELKLPDGSVGLDVNIALKQPQTMETMNIATSWKENRKAFYLNQKVNCMETTGIIRRGFAAETIEKDTTFSLLDWGRGNWTYSNTWYWASTSGLIDQVPFGLNLGYGFSDRTSASENVIFYDGKIHKLEEVSFTIPKGYTEGPWKIQSPRRLDLSFTPTLDRNSHFNFKVIKSLQHQVFGTFEGTAVLDDGTVLQIPHLLGFAEKVQNKW